MTMYPQQREIVLFGVDDRPLKAFVPEIKIRMNKGKAFDLKKVTSSKDGYDILKRIYGRSPIQENFIVLLLNRANKVTGFYKHTIGSSYATIADIPMIVGLATKAIAHGVIISHNHPSGTLAPSDPDRELTRSLKQALETVKINLLDHIIYTNEGYYSFADQGILNGINNTTMITVNNLLERYPEIDQSILPDALKAEEFGFIRENFDLYGEDETIKKYIDTFVEKLNSVVSSHEEKEDSGKALPSAAKKKPGSKRTKTAPKAKPPKKAVEPDGATSPAMVEKVAPEVSFIKRYVSLHGRIKEKQHTLNFLNSLQKAILEKRIRKTSSYAKEIMGIQGQLIKCYKNMGDTIQVNIDTKTLEAYRGIATSEKAMLSVTYIRQYIGLHGKQNVKEKAEKLLLRMEKAIASGKITPHCPYWDEISEITGSLKQYLSGKTNAPVIQESTLNGIMSWAVKKTLQRQMAKQLSKEAGKGLHGVEKDTEVMPSTHLQNIQFETIGLQGKYRELIGDPSIGFTAMVFGLPKSGKSTLCIDFARYLAENHGKVLYVAIEEGFGYTLKEKFERLNAIHPNLVLAEKLPEDMSAYRFVFIDSVSKAGLSSLDLDNLKKRYPSTAFIYIFHTTKDGNFRGKQDFAHDVDVIVEVEDGIARANGRFGVGGKLNIFDNVENEGI